MGALCIMVGAWVTFRNTLRHYIGCHSKFACSRSYVTIQYQYWRDSRTNKILSIQDADNSQQVLIYSLVFASEIFLECTVQNAVTHTSTLK